MKKQELLEKFRNEHTTFIEYINSLSETEFGIHQPGKWTPAQQLAHILLCLTPLAGVLADKPGMESKFGRITRPTQREEGVIRSYKAALSAGGKAPGRFVPETVFLNQRDELEVALLEQVKALEKNLEWFSEEELDFLALPHPLLGFLSIREMLYLMGYHASHHREETIKNLKSSPRSSRRD